MRKGIEARRTPSPVKRKSVRDRNREATPSQHASKAEQHTLGTSPEILGATSAPAAADSATVPTTGSNELSDPGQADAHTGGETLAREETSRPGTGATVSEATATTDAGAEARWETSLTL